MQVIQPYIWILWDLAAVGIIFRSVQKSARRGFVSTVLGLLIYIVASVVAVKTHAMLAVFLYDNVLHEVIQHVLVRSFNDMLGQIGENTNDILHSIPFALRILIGFKGGEVAAIQSDDANEIASQVIETALKNPIMTILNTVSFLIIFTLAAYVMRELTKFFTGVNKVPVIGALNIVLGAAAGVIEGIIMLFISGFIMRMVIAVSGEVWWWLNSAVINETLIWRLFY